MTLFAFGSANLRKHLSKGVAVGAIGVLSLVAVGCSSDSSTDSSAKAKEPAPESVFAPDSEVTTGLANLKTIFASAAAAASSKSASAAYPDQLEDQWSKIEGTVKKNEPLLYTEIEDALSQIDNALKDEKASAATTASTSFDTTADAYLAKHP
jgi:hypothetical protein